MAYVLEALVGDLKTLREGVSTITGSHVIALGFGLGLLPLTGEIFESIGGGECGEFMKLSEAVERLARELSIKSPVAYLEAEYFGGVGAQSAVIWANGVKAGEMLREEHSINRALRELGVHLADAHDEFDEVRLGRHRGTGEWFEELV
jgi:hypothetical protein